MKMLLLYKFQNNFCVCVKFVMHLILMFKQKQLIIIILTCKEEIFKKIPD